MTLRILLGVILALTFAIVFLLLICRLIAARPVDEVYDDADRNMDAIRCSHCQRPKIRGVQHGRGWCVTSPMPPPPPVQPRLVEATYRRSAR